MEWREEAGLRWLEAELDGARAVFTTRRGGVSAPPFDQLNLGALGEDEERAVLANRRRLAAALDLAPEQIVSGRQVHGAALAAHHGPQDPSPFAVAGAVPIEADGQLTANPDLAPLVFAADCLPVALAGPGGVAMLHCGWRGLAAGIIAAGAAAIDATAAAIGPGIGPCCYEVGPETTAPFRTLGEGVVSGEMLDLPEAARRQLRAAGVARVESAGLCTSCNPGLFFSHRRDRGRTGRQAGLVQLRG